MQNLLYFLYRYRTFGLFLLLEVICAWLIISYNNRPNAAFLNSSNSLVASVNRFSNNTTDYFQLQKINTELVEENLILREQLANQSLKRLSIDSSNATYVLYKAKVINNTYRRSMNYLTLNAGVSDGLRPGMGVVSGLGVVGQVKSVSNHFSTVTSLLHRNLLVSSTISRTGTLCTVQWDAEDPREAELKFIPRHIDVKVGDEVVTSGYNSIFPEGISLGEISSLVLQPNDVFYEAKIALAVDFSSLNDVFVIEHTLKMEQDSLESQINVR